MTGGFVMLLIGFAIELGLVIVGLVARHEVWWAPLTLAVMGAAALVFLAVRRS